MPLNDVDLVSRRFSVGLATDQVEFIVYSYDEETFDEQHFQSVSDLISLLKNRTEQKKSHWIEVINRSSRNLPNNITSFCEYFNIHPLTIEDITTLAPCMKLDFFDDQSTVYLLMKIISWNDHCVKQQQISFYLKYSQNILITFQEQTNGFEQCFDEVRNRLRRQQRVSNGEQSPFYPHSRLQQMNVDYLFYCLLDTIIDRYMLVLEEIAIRIDQFDEKLMADKQSLSLSTLHSIYRIKHDLLHLRILFNPLKEIISRLQRTTEDDQFLFPRTDPSLRLNLKHHLVRRQIKPLLRSPQIPCTQLQTTINMTNNSSRKVRRTPVLFNEHIYIYLSDLSDHINQLIDTIEIQRESVSMLVSFWITLNNNETQEILKFLMLITVLFMPGLLLTGMNSTNFNVQPQYQYKYGYYIVLALLSTILFIQPNYKQGYEFSLSVPRWYNSLRKPESIREHVHIFEEDLSQLIEQMKELIFLDIYGKIRKKKS